MKYAIIDAETNGLPDYKKPADDPSQPRLASLGVVLALVSDDRRTIKVEVEHEFLVKPDGWKMTEEAGAVNGLTDERLAAEGKPITDLLAFYAALVEDGYVVVAYGAQHDCKIMRGEFRRAGLPDHFEQTKNICLMRAVQPLKIPKANGKGGWPQLDDVLRYVGQKAEPRPHGALVGARCAMAIFAAFLPKGLLPDAAVHYAKNPPMPASPAEKPAPAAKPKRGDRKTEGGVLLEHNGLQWLPVVNKENYPKLFNEDGTRKGAAPAPLRPLDEPIGREGQTPETAADVPTEDRK